MKNILWGITLLMGISSFGQSYLDTIRVVKKTNEKITLDGFLTESMWDNASKFPFTEWRPDWGLRDTLTTLYITFDDTNLYVGLEARDQEPDKIISRNLVRDSWYGDDYFAFHIDPNQTKKNAFVFSIYPSGSRYDAAISNNNIPLGRSTFNRAYDMIWKGKTQITASGWQAEYSIPLSNLRFEIRNGKVLGAISAQRTINHQNKLLVYPRITRDVPGANGMPSLKQPVVFEGLIPKKDLQITPYILANTQKRYVQNTNENRYKRESNNEIDAGLDVRYGITANLTLDATLNTDFSQVEIDDQIVNLNRASIFFPERRKFFQEQAGLFDFNLGILSQLFYSRVIGINNGKLTPIIGGVRLTGELNNWDIGMLSLQTEGIRVGEDTFASENFSVLRLRKKMFNDRSFLGLMATQRIRKGYVNSALGLDGMIDLGKSNFLIGSIATTLEGEKYSNTSYKGIENTRIAVQIDKRKQDHWFYRGAYEFSGNQFNPGMGFLLREKHHNFYGSLNNGKFHNSRKESVFQYRRWMLVNSDLYFTTDFSKVLTWYNRSQWTGRFFSGDEVSLFGQVQYEFLQEPLSFSDKIVIPGGDYFFKFFGASYTTGTQRSFKLPVRVQYGEFYDGKNLEFGISPEWNLNEHFTLEGSWRVNYLDFKDRNVKEWINVPQIKVNWAYDLHFSGNIIGQYNSLNDQVFASARLRYNFRDGHDVYFVYNQDYNTDRNNETMRPPYYNNQLFTIKYTYTFVK